MMKKNKHQKILFSKELLKATNEKTKIEVDPDDLIKDVSNEDDQIIWKNPITGIYGQPLKWVSVPKTIHDMRKKREKIKPS